MKSDKSFCFSKVSKKKFLLLFLKRNERVQEILAPKLLANVTQFSTDFLYALIRYNLVWKWHLELVCNSCQFGDSISVHQKNKKRCVVPFLWLHTYKQLQMIPLRQWGCIICKHNVRWRYLSRMKVVLFCGQKIFTEKCRKQQAIIRDK